MLTSLFGIHVDSPEFQSMLREYFPDFQKFDKNREYKDKKSKIVLRIDSLTAYDDDAPIPEDPREYRYFIAFFIGTDESDIPYGLTSHDDEQTIISKAGEPTHNHKIIGWGILGEMNDLHYHIDNYKLLISLDMSGEKQLQPIGVNLRLKGMKY
jgi:hypothetical protein